MARAATYTAEELAELLGVSPWAVYQAAKRDEPAIGSMAIRVGRRLLWPRAAVDKMLGLPDDDSSQDGSM
jgi:hypothetical protein